MTNATRRIQLRRTAGWKKPPNTVCAPPNPLGSTEGAPRSIG
jgi:hypothetical protein